MQNSTVYLYSNQTSSYSLWVFAGNRGTPRTGDVVHSHYDEPQNGGGGGRNGHPNGNVNHPREVIAKKDIIINLLKDKALCAFQKINNQNLFKNTIGKFESDPSYNLVLRAGKLSDCGNRAGVAACTDGDNNSKDPSQPITIYIVDSNQPVLSMAATLLHEGIHAEIFRYVSQHKSGVDPNDRPRLLQLYQYYKGLSNKFEWSDGPVTTAQHEYMSTNYVIPIAEAMRKLDGYRFPTENYKGFAWEGLENTYKFKNLLTKTEKSFYAQKKAQINSTTNVSCN